MVRRYSLLVALWILVYSSTIGFAADDDLTFHASFDGTTSAIKASGSPEPKTPPADISFIDGISGKAIVLNNNSVMYNQQSNIYRNRGTAMFWIKPIDWDPKQTTNGYCWFFSANLGGGDVDRIQFFKLPNTILYFMFGEKSQIQTIVKSTEDWSQGEWKFFAISWDENWMKLFVNGNLISKLKTTPDQIPTNTGDEIQIASTKATAYDELRIFDKPLTEEQVKDYYLADSINIKATDSLETAAPAITHDDMKAHIVIPFASRPPVIDGRINTGEWDSTSVITGFLKIPQLEYTPRQTVVKACYDKDNIYFQISSKLDGQPVAKENTHDGAVYTDDSYEIFLTPGSSSVKKAVYQFVFNSKDAHYESQNNDQSWDCNWITRSTITKTSWTAEVAIPFKDLVAVPSPGDTWLFNLGRNWNNPSVFTNPTLILAYNTVDGFMSMTFGKENDYIQNYPLDKLNSRIADVTGQFSAATPGKYVVKSRIKKSDTDLTNKTGLTSFDSIPGKTVFEESKQTDLNKGDISNYSFSKKMDDKGLYLIQTTITGPNGRFYNQVVPFKVADLLAVDLNCLSKDKQLKVQWELTGDIGQILGVTGSITDKQGKIVLIKPAANNKSGKGEIVFDISSLKQTDYTINVQAKGTLTSVSQSKVFKCYAASNWLGFENKLRGQHVVPNPWIPIKSTDQQINTLLQKYKFTDGPFPTEIIADGTQILAGPVELSTSINGSSVIFKAQPRKWISKAPDKVSNLQNLNEKNIQLKVNTSCEFDGMMRFDLVLTPANKKGTKLSGLRLEIPIKQQYATLKLPYFGIRQKWNVFDLDCSVGNYWRGTFTPHVWIGNDDKGISWFAETDQQFSLADESKAIEIIKKSGRVILRINMVDRPTLLKSPLKYTFGIMGTPARPLAKDWFAHRFASTVSTTSRPVISMGYTAGSEYHAKKGIPYPAKDEARFKESLSTDPTVKNLIYITANGVGSEVSEYKYYMQEWRNPDNRDTWSYLTSGEYHDGACPNSTSWRDFFLYSCVKARDEYGIDGFYYDFGTVMGCSNPVHGCGYMHNKDKRATYPIFSDRELRKNIYILLSQHKQPYFVYHNYSNIVALITSFSNMTLDGEAYQQKTGVVGNKITNDYSEMIPMPRLRAMFGTQFGTTPYFLAKFNSEDEKLVKPTRTILAMTLPCGIQVWGFYCNTPELNKVYGAQDQFKFAESTFTPYWKQNKAFTAGNSDIIAGFWKKPDSALVVLSNLTGKDYDGLVVINTIKLFNNKAVKVTDTATGEQIPVVNNTIQLKIESKDFRMLKVQAD